MTTSRYPTPLIATAIIVVCMIGAAIAWFSLDPGLRMTSAEAAIASTEPSDDFETRVRDYLLANPEVIIEAAQRFEEKQRLAQLAESKDVLFTRAEELFRDPESPVGGNPLGDATLVEFFDYNCPYCRDVASVMAEAEAANPGLRIVYKEFPILGPNSVFAAKAALASERQGKYSEFHQLMMQSSAQADESSVISAAETVGLNIEQLRIDMEDAAIQAQIDRNIDLALALRINGTPGFVIGEEILRGAADLATIQSLVDKARNTDIK